MYRLLATVFLVIGGGFLVVVVVQAITGAGLIDGKALGPALVLLLVGVLLVWTIRSLPPAEPDGSSDALDATRPRSDDDVRPDGG